jgi:hypothetical protein
VPYREASNGGQRKMQYGWWGTIPVVLAAVGYLLRR